MLMQDTKNVTGSRGLVNFQSSTFSDDTGSYKSVYSISGITTVQLMQAIETSDLFISTTKHTDYINKLAYPHLYCAYGTTEVEFIIDIHKSRLIVESMSTSLSDMLVKLIEDGIS